jgi:hypothetical protein
MISWLPIGQFINSFISASQAVLKIPNHPERIGKKAIIAEAIFHQRSVRLAKAFGKFYSYLLL